MQHVLSTYLLVEQRLNTVTLEKVRDEGFSHIEIFCALQHIDWRNKAQINELSYWFRDTGCHLHALHAPLFTDEVWGRSGPHSVLTTTELSKPARLASVGELKRALEIAEVIPCRYFITRLGTPGEEFDERKWDAAFTALEDLSVFAKHRGVEVLLENIPSALSRPERLVQFLEITHLPLGVCFDTGYANLTGGVEAAYSILGPRIRSTHLHDNDGASDLHLLPLLENGGTIGWRRTMELLRSRDPQYPLVLEAKEPAGGKLPLAAARECFDRLESL